MEGSSELVGSNDQTQNQIKMKGKRTKRPRQPSPHAPAVASSSDDAGAADYNSSIYSSPTTSSTCAYESATEEEEDMANCLILLAQGDLGKDGQKKEEKCSSRKVAEMVTAGAGKAGIYVYECKTCNRSFPSFQALGGHRASHKKPKNIVEEKKAEFVLPSDDFDLEGDKMGKGSPPISLPISNKSFQGNKSKTHECSICGSEFASGQALGGHMRRHRAPAAGGASEAEAEKPRNVLELDLNLPAPEDDHRDSKFQFVTPQPSLVFSSPALVDCHY